MSVDDVIKVFDRLALEYDELFEKADSVKRMRKELFRWISARVPTGGRILDINCGTGTDCAALASAGYETTGLDISPVMISKARIKGVCTGAQFVVGSFEDLSRFYGKSFHLVLSNFGGLNCTPRMKHIVKSVHRLLVPDGYFIVVLMTPFSIWEVLTGLLTGRIGYAFRRRRKHTTVSGHVIEVSYYREAHVRAMVQGLYEIEAIRAWNILSPPPNAESFARRHPRTTAVLRFIDRYLTELPLLRRWGDHAVYILKMIEDVEDTESDRSA